MATLRELKGRIGSVASSEKITGAMKMISSAKMHKAEQALRRLQPFRTLIEGIIGNLLTSDAEFATPLTQERDVNTLAVVVWGSDDGLCGAYNVNIYKDLISNIARVRTEVGHDVKIIIYPIGQKIAKAAAKLAQQSNVSVAADVDVNSKTSGDKVKAFLESLEERFLHGEVDRVDTLYMKFHSVSRQRPTYEQLIPVSTATFAQEGVKESCRPCIFEPSAQDIFHSVIPMFLLAVLQDIFTENRASEMAARIMAMQAANDNAKKLLEQLQLEYNKLRQQAITSELLDIVGGQIR